MSKSELKRLGTVDPIGMAEKMAKQEEELAALREKNAELQHQLHSAEIMYKITSKRADRADRLLDEPEKPEPVGYLHVHPHFAGGLPEFHIKKDSHDDMYPVYATPVNLPALIEQAKREEREALAMAAPAKLFNCTCDSHVRGAYKDGWNAACDKMLAAIRARSGK